MSLINCAIVVVVILNVATISWLIQTEIDD